MLSWQLSGLRKMDYEDALTDHYCRIMARSDIWIPSLILSVFHNRPVPMAPSHCQTPLRHSLRVSAWSHNPTSTPRPRHTRSSTTEELLTKITKVMDVVEKDMKLRHSETRQLRQRVCQAEKTQTLAEDRCSDLQNNISAVHLVFLTADLIMAIGTLVPQDFPVNNPLPSDEDLWADVFYTKDD
ncbi:hypothetical protein EDC04DRAFT_2617940 [Pisolithus marmoratus]|nr:hypothetical protein EDC04DRAFT_2617940 [Pisolithus marmoratus]